MEASVIETVAKYFYFSCLDEKQSFTASLRVLSELKANDQIKPESRHHWVSTLTKWRGRLKHLPRRTWTDSPSEEAIQTPDGVDLMAWSQFATSADPTEVEAVLLSRILGFSDEEVAEGLGISLGTVRYRVGRGLRRLGGFLES